jgi:hypothetical protein
MVIGLPHVASRLVMLGLLMLHTGLLHVASSLTLIAQLMLVTALPLVA